jgi:serine/threonine protein kinase
MDEVAGFHDITKVGSGGLGDVHRAIRTSTGTEVAIKELRSESGHEASVRRANRELAALASLRGHPHVVNLEEVIPSPTGGGLLLVMEYSAAGSVADRAADAGSMLPVPEVILIGEHGANALLAAHVNGVIHRDIKPQNLLIGPFGQVKVCDFGISSIAESDDFGTKTNAVSYRFASPEELRGDATITPKADIYSLGVTLAKLLTNRYFNFETAPHLLDMAATPGLAGVDSSHGHIELEVRRLLVRCLAHQADQRPNASTVGDELDTLARSLGDDRCKQLSVSRSTTTAPSASPTGALSDAGVGASTPVDLPIVEEANAVPLSVPRRRLHPLWYAAVALWAAVAVIAVIVLTGDDAGSGNGQHGITTTVLEYTTGHEQ